MSKRSRSSQPSSRSSSTRKRRASSGGAASRAKPAQAASAAKSSAPSRRPFRVGRAATGFGLFATRRIEKGDFIAHYWGRKLRNADADKLDTKYLFELNSRWTIDGSNRRNLARYINHSCRPNAESDVKRGKIVITACKAIEPGTEITFNYGKDYFSAFIEQKGCRCLACESKKLVRRSSAKRKKT